MMFFRKKKSPEEELRAYMVEVGKAHHKAFRTTGGKDDEWPIWYAGYTLEGMQELLGLPRLTKSELVHFFVEADRRYRAEGEVEPWPDFYTRFFRAKAEEWR